MNNATVNDSAQFRPTMVGNPMLTQVRDFIEQDEGPPAIDPIGIVVRALRGRAHLVAMTTLLAALLAAMGAFLAIKPAYQSSGMLRILPTEEKILYADQDDSRLRLYDAFFNSEMRLLTSRPILENALQKLDQIDERGFPIPEDVGGLAAMVSVAGSKGLISLASRSSEPRLSAAAVNAVIAAYQESNEAARSRTYNVRREELGTRESELQTSLDELNDEYLQVGGEHDASTLAKAHVAKTAQLEVIEERIAELDNTIAQMQLTGGVGAGVGDRVEIQRATLLDQAMADMTFERAKRLAALETLKGRYQPSHPRLRSSQLELDILESSIDERRNQIALLGQAGALTGSGSSADEESLEDLQGVMKRLVARRDTVRNEAAELNSKLIRIRGIAMEKDRLEELLAETKRALDKVLVESQNDLSRSIEIVAFGNVPNGPIEDKRKPAALGASVFASLASLALFIGWTVLGGRVRFSDDLEDRSRDVLGAVIRQDHDPARGFLQAARKLRNEMDLRWPLVNSETLVIGVAGTASTAGTTSIAHALGEHYSQAGFNVLLVDANPGENGLSAVCADACDTKAATSTASGNPPVKGIQRIAGRASSWHLLPSCHFSASETDQADSKEMALGEMRELLISARTGYNLIVLDLGVLTAGRQSAVGAALADRCVLVTACGRSRKEIAGSQNLLDRLKPAHYLLALNRASALDPAPGTSPALQKPKFSAYFTGFKFRFKSAKGV